MDRHNINIVQNTFPWLFMFIVPVFKRKIYTRCYIMVAINMEFIIVYLQYYTHAVHIIIKYAHWQIVAVLLSKHENVVFAHIFSCYAQ